MTTPTSNCSGQITPIKEAIDSRCIVKFVPHTDWKGEYGFDWYRTEDIRDTFFHFISKTIIKNNKEKLDKDDELVEGIYPNIVGKYDPYDPDEAENNNGNNNNNNNTVINLITEPTLLTQIENEYTPLIPIVDLDDDSCHPYYCTPYISLFYKSRKPSVFDLPDFMKKDKNHILDWLTTEAKVDLLISAKGIKEIVFECYDGSVSVVDKKNKTAIISPVVDGNSTKEIIIKLNYDFYGAYQPIKAYAIHQDNSKTLAGQINVVKCIPTQVNVCLVNVKCSRPGSSTKINGLSKTQIEQQKKWLRRYLSQAHVVPNIDVKALEEGEHEKKDDHEAYNLHLNNFWINRNGEDVFTAVTYKPIHYGRYKWSEAKSNPAGNTLEQSFNTAYPDPKYRSYYKIFFLGVKGYDYKYSASYDNRDILQETRTNFTLLGGRANEIHSTACVVFENPDSSTACHELLHCMGLYHSFSNNSKHTLKKEETSNIMDYSKYKISLWRWQWEKIRTTATFRHRHCVNY